MNILQITKRRIGPVLAFNVQIPDHVECLAVFFILYFVASDALLAGRLAPCKWNQAWRPSALYMCIEREKVDFKSREVNCLKECALAFTILFSILQIFCSWEAIFNLRLSMAFLFHILHYMQGFSPLMNSLCNASLQQEYATEHFKSSWRKSTINPGIP